MSQPTTSSEDRRTKRAGVLRLALAGVAVLGVGAAATSAAWTDDAWFRVEASAAEIQLQASVDGSTWEDADVVGDAVVVVLDEDAFENMVPAEVRTFTLHLKNDSPVDLALSLGDVTTAGAMFGGTAPAEAAVGAFGQPVLEPGDETTFVLTVTAGDWDDTYQGSPGTVTIQIHGTTTA